MCSLLAALVPYWAGLAVGDLEQGNWTRSHVHLAWMLAFTLGAGLSRYLMRMVLIGLSRRIEKAQREQLFDFLLSRPQGFYERHRIGDLMSRIGDDVGTVRMATGPGLMSLLQTVTILPATLALMIHTSPSLTFAVMIPFSFLALGFYVIGQFSHANQQKLQLVSSALNTFSHETISGEKVIQAFGLEPQRIQEFKDLSRHQALLNIRQSALFSTYSPLAGLIGGAALLIMVAYGGRLVLRRELTLGDLTAFSGYLVALAWPVMSLGWSLNLFQRARAGQERIDQVLSDPEPPLPSPGPLPLQSGPSSLGLRKVVHRFETSRGLGPVDLELPSGSSVAVLGSIGSGKTLLLQVLAGLRPPHSGEVLAEGRPLAWEDLRSHWAGLGWVPQEAFLFSTSLRENLVMGFPEATEEDVKAVLEAVCLDDLIRRLPLGLDTVVGERGVILSGGERQRTALARALLRKPRLLLLDDALSAVDTETEGRIVQFLRQNLGRTTLVLATHRVAVAELCQRVVILEEGRIVQQGSPQELAEQHGTFARLKRLQTLEKEVMGA